MGALGGKDRGTVGLYLCTCAKKAENHKWTVSLCSCAFHELISIIVGDILCAANNLHMLSSHTLQMLTGIEDGFNHLQMRDISFHLYLFSGLEEDV